MLTHCPRCQSSFEANKVIGDSAICGCGWSGPLSTGKIGKKKRAFASANSQFPRKKRSAKFFVNLGLVALSAAAFGYGAKTWGGYMIERGVYTVKGAVKLNSSSDEFRMAVICHQLQKQTCVEDSLGRAYRLDPQNVALTGEYAISLTDGGKYDQAILAFQKFFSQSEGTARHKYKFAEALGKKEYYNDSKEWYYKAIVEAPENLEIAESMMNMLSRSHQYGEAMSIIGHFNMVLPQTQKLWHTLTINLKNEFKEYQEKYQIKEMTISKLGNYFFAPGILGGAMDTQLFIVNPDAVYTTVDMNYLKMNGIKYESKGEITVQPTNGSQIKGTRVILPSLMFGAWQLKNVEAIACDNCAFMAGKSVLSQLSVQTSQVTNTKVNLLSMKEK